MKDIARTKTMFGCARVCQEYLWATCQCRAGNCSQQTNLWYVRNGAAAVRLPLTGKPPWLTSSGIQPDGRHVAMVS